MDVLAPETAERCVRGDSRLLERDHGAQDVIGDRRHDRRGRNREDPRPHDPPGDAPPHRRQPLRRADADDRARDRVRRAHRNAEVRRDAGSPAAPPVSAQNPPTGRSFVMREPIVCTIRQPPNSVPSEIARVRADLDPERNRARCPAGRSGAASPVSSANVRLRRRRAAPTMMPIVFCASLPPCEYEKQRRAHELRRPEESVDARRPTSAGRSRTRSPSAM